MGDTGTLSLGLKLPPAPQEGQARLGREVLSQVSPGTWLSDHTLEVTSLGPGWVLRLAVCFPFGELLS